MNTVTLLHDRSSEMPEGLYLDLMNKLKIDFDSDKITNVLIINAGIKKTIQCSKQHLINEIIKYSVTLKNREEILIKLAQGLFFHDIKKMCKEYKIPTMRVNPLWIREQAKINNNRELLISLGLSPNSSVSWHINEI